MAYTILGKSGHTSTWIRRITSCSSTDGTDLRKNIIESEGSVEMWCKCQAKLAIRKKTQEYKFVLRSRIRGMYI